MPEKLEVERYECETCSLKLPEDRIWTCDLCGRKVCHDCVVVCDACEAYFCPRHVVVKRAYEFFDDFRDDHEVEYEYHCPVCGAILEPGSWEVQVA